MEAVDEGIGLSFRSFTYLRRSWSKNLGRTEVEVKLSFKLKEKLESYEFDSIEIERLQKLQRNVKKSSSQPQKG